MLGDRCPRVQRLLIDWMIDHHEAPFMHQHRMVLFDMPETRCHKQSSVLDLSADIFLAVASGTVLMDYSVQPRPFVLQLFIFFNL